MNRIDTVGRLTDGTIWRKIARGMGGPGMKRTALIVFTVFAASAIALAQGRGAPAPPPPLEPGASQADVDKAVLALPENLRSQATVIKWKPDYTYDTLRKGTNGLVCYDRSGYPLQQPFALECTSTANLDRQA